MLAPGEPLRGDHSIIGGGTTEKALSLVAILRASLGVGTQRRTLDVEHSIRSSGPDLKLCMALFKTTA